MINNQLKSHFLNLYMLALSDSSFDERELQTILKIGEEKGISQSEFEKIIINPASVKVEYPEDFLSRIRFLYDFTRVIWADDHLDEDEKEAFLKICKRFDFEEEESGELLEWLSGLAKRGVPAEEIKNEITNLTN